MDHTTAVSTDVDDGHRRGRRNARFETDGDAAAAADGAGAFVKHLLVEWFFPGHALRQALKHRLDAGIAHHGARCLRPAFAQNILPANRQWIDAQRFGNHVGMAFVSPHQLRDTKTAQSPGRRQVGVQRIGIDADMVDVIRASRGET